MSRHESRQKLATEFGATDIVTEREDEGVARIKEMTKGIGADSVLECVGTLESMMQAIRSTRPGGSIGYVGVPHDAHLDLQQVFFTLVRLHGGPAPVRHYLPNLIKLVLDGKINPGNEVVEKLYANSPPDQMHIQRFLSANCFGDNYTRSGIDIPTRELLTRSILVALGGCDPQVKGHVAANLNVGNDRARLIDVVTQLLPFIGYPRTLNALRAIDELTAASLAPQKQEER